MPNQPEQTRPLLTPDDLAARWSVTVASLANQRSLRRGPTYLKLGGAIRYALADVEAYETAGRVELAA